MRMSMIGVCLAAAALSVMPMAASAAPVEVGWHGPSSVAPIADLATSTTISTIGLRAIRATPASYPASGGRYVSIRSTSLAAAPLGVGALRRTG